MSRFGDGELQKKEQISQPHPDLGNNVRFFNDMMSKVAINSKMEIVDEKEIKIPLFQYEISDRIVDSIFNPSMRCFETISRIKEYKNASFFWNAFGETMGSVISFHIPNRQFREELSFLLNQMHLNGYISRKGAFPKKQAIVDEDDKWAAFTPKPFQGQ